MGSYSRYSLSSSKLIWVSPMWYRSGSASPLHRSGQRHGALGRLEECLFPPCPGAATLLVREPFQHRLPQERDVPLHAGSAPERPGVLEPHHRPTALIRRPSLADGSQGVHGVDLLLLRPLGIQVVEEGIDDARSLGVGQHDLKLAVDPLVRDRELRKKTRADPGDEGLARVRRGIANQGRAGGPGGSRAMSRRPWPPGCIRRASRRRSRSPRVCSGSGSGPADPPMLDADAPGHRRPTRFRPTSCGSILTNARRAA